MLYLSQGWIVYVFIFLVMPFLLSIRSYIWGRGGYAFLNRNNIGTLKGIAILLIVMQSVGERLTHRYPVNGIDVKGRDVRINPLSFYLWI